MKKISLFILICTVFFTASCGGSASSGPEFTECGENPVFPCADAASGLVWSEKSPLSKVWNEAVFYCESLEEGGEKNWRLPDIDELRTLVQDCYGTVKGGECMVNTGCLVYDSCWSTFCKCEFDDSGKYCRFGDLGGLWSSSEAGSEGAWYINFYEAKIIDEDKENSYSVRCVSDI